MNVALWIILTLLAVIYHPLAGDLIPKDEQAKWESIIALHRKVSIPQLDGYLDWIDNLTLDHNVRTSINETCLASLSLFASLARNGEGSSIKMFESSARSWNGISQDVDFDLGHFDGCVNTMFDGHPARYTLVQVHFPKSDIFADDYSNPNSWLTKIRKRIGHITHIYSLTGIALCLPGQCTNTDIKAIVESDLISKAIDPLKLTFLSGQAVGESSFDERVMISSTISAGIIISLIMTCLYATIKSFYYPHSVNPLTRCFDMVNSHRVLTAPVKDEEDGRLRFYSLFKAYYLMIGTSSHTFGLFNSLTLPILEPGLVFMRDNDIPRLIFIMYLWTSANIVVSSSLATISLLPVFGKTSLTLLLIARLARVVPVVLFSILLQLSIPAAFSTGGHGPLFPSVYKNVSDNCLQNGWREIVMVSNFTPLSSSCNHPSWLISADFQMFLISLILMSSLKRSLRLGLLVASIQFILGWFLYLKHVETNTNPPYLHIASDRDPNFGHNYVVKLGHPFGHISTYVVGILLGYFLLQTQASKRQSINWKMTVIGLSGMALAIVISYLIYDRHGHAVISDYIGLLWTSVHRIVFVTSFAILAYFFLSRNKTVLNWGSCRPVTFLSRISFTSFLVHSVLIMFFQARHRQPMQVDLFIQLLYMVSFMLFGIFFGYLTSILIEVPSVNIIKLYLKSSKEAKKMS